ncbi:hypothetical protein AMJ80_01490 [bacterium SM23_31]|nr:MAG: hypothetical protein AMJ80_01490 [bacterium SM23_31]
MKFFHYSIAVLLLFFNCGDDVDVQPLEIPENIIENVFEPEMTFGNDEKLGDFLLVNPMWMAAANNGDIIVADGQYLKIFNNNGEPKKLVGGPGQGPGEFPEQIYNVLIADNGYITVTGYSDFRMLNIFAPDYSFVEMTRFENNPLIKKLSAEAIDGRFYVESVYSYGPDEFFVNAGWASKIDESTSAFYHIRNGEASLIKEFKAKVDKTTLRIFPYYLLSNKRIMYIDPELFKEKRGDDWYYILHIHDLNTYETTQIERQYVPVRIPDSLMVYKEPKLPPAASESLKKAMIKGEKERIEELKKKKVYDFYKKIYTDNNLIFVVTYIKVPDKGYVVEIIDAGTGEYLRSAFFDFFPQVLKNGYAYRLMFDRNIFPYVEKYIINPAVYGK